MTYHTFKASNIDVPINLFNDRINNNEMTTILKGIITSDLTLDAGEYWIDGLVQIPSSVTLTVSPGTIINGAKETSGLLIAGNLTSTGTLNDPVIFNGVTTEFNNSQGSAIAFTVFGNSNTALFLNGDSPVTINESLFINNSIAITDNFGYQYMGINNSTFSNNTTVFAGIRTLGGEFLNNQFNNNNSVFDYGYYFGDVFISNNNFDSNGFVIKAPETGYGYGIVSMQGNWWGTTNSSLIDSLIYDQLDLVTLQKINYLPLLDKPNNVGAKFANSEPTGTVTITGTALLGQTLAASNILVDANGLGTISYQWLANGKDILDATGNAFTLTSSQAGKSITVIANYTDLLGTKESISSIATSPVGTNVLGSIGNNILTGFAGNDTINGGDGLDVVNYLSTISNYKVTKSISSFSISSSSDGVDMLTNVERLKFIDTNLALDLDGNAGKVAKILGAVFGAASVSNKEYVGIGLSYLDNGMSYSDLTTLALNAVGATTNDAIVTKLWTNVIGTAPIAADKAPFLEMLNDGIKAGDLGVLAADTIYNTTNINLVGLAQTGIEYN